MGEMAEYYTEDNEGIESDHYGGHKRFPADNCQLCEREEAYREELNKMRKLARAKYPKTK